MPELPEVITITRDLKKEITNKKIVEINNFNNYRLEDVKKIKEGAVNTNIVAVENIAKLITIELSNENYLVTHLNMSGRLLYNNKDPYIKIKIKFNTGDELFYSSIRMFGYFELWNKKQIEEYKTRYGKTALDSTLTLGEFTKNIKRSNSFIKNNLLNQKFISGIGNIYANDALFISGIHPKKKVSDLSKQEYKVLFDSIKKILNEGIEHRGSTIDRYADLYGNPGWHQKHFRIYGKKNEKCKDCGTDIIFEKIQGRGTYICPTCQPLEVKENRKGLF